ncbi:hypothetical protein GUJ93_ZPchr0006g45078 [Zizania palustris]|uniref:Uncharacterized protein n=1 Tax=Zizania palustris TaxID=103762 RepID=A0A8J5T1Q3_ZIZPA|nr:hypothetical protein GUJ93_ZPchr0006g45078 [Zizania palustris]
MRLTSASMHSTPPPLTSIERRLSFSLPGAAPTPDRSSPRFSANGSKQQSGTDQLRRAKTGVQCMDLPGPRWKKGKDGKDFTALAAANPMSAIFAELIASFTSSMPIAILSGPGGAAILGVQPEQAVILIRAVICHTIENMLAEKHWFKVPTQP